MKRIRRKMSYFKERRKKLVENKQGEMEREEEKEGSDEQS